MSSCAEKTTNKERMRIAINRGKPDRVPCGCFFNCDYISRMAGVDLFEWLFLSNDLRVRGLEAIHQAHAQDWMMCDPGVPQEWTESHHLIEEEGELPHIVENATGKHIRIRKDFTVENHVEMGCSEFLPWSGMGYSFSTRTCRVSDIDSPATARKAIQIHPAEELIRRGAFGPLGEYARRHGQERYLCFWGGNLIFNTIYFFGSMEEGLLATIEKRDLFEEIAQINLEQEIESLKAAKACGGDGMWMAEMLASRDIVAPDFYRAVVLPAERKLIQTAHDLGIQVFIYLTGDVVPAIPMLREIGIDGVVPENNDKRGGRIDVADLRKAAEMDMAVFGNIDPLYDLERGDTQKIRAEVKHQIEAAGSEGAFITHSNIVPGTVSPERVNLMIEANREFGAYS